MGVIAEATGKLVAHSPRSAHKHATKELSSSKMLGSAPKTTMSVQDADTNLSVVEISDGETSNSTTDSEDQTFVERTKLSVGNQQRPMAKVLFFDGIRGLAAILVVIHHSKEYPTDKLHLGAVAVDIFFVLSSFLLTWLFIKRA
ncbi:hypothetical protein GN244_ATG07278 [Phytophthora infestans]|uniref:Acyltransferase 3 domain-containing protein n=1 Tax=Phytophthora infestans TaxID=4787 RepID=A0A833SWS5_PHYIN|nr:hypothetical protein GN244_ATG07278 [Phytophthora infestans]